MATNNNNGGNKMKMVNDFVRDAEVIKSSQWVGKYRVTGKTMKAKKSMLNRVCTHCGCKISKGEQYIARTLTWGKPDKETYDRERGAYVMHGFRWTVDSCPDCARLELEVRASVGRVMGRCYLDEYLEEYGHQYRAAFGE